jgi:hypothetical protein
MFGGKMD